MLKLVGLYDSPFVRRVAISMHILGIPFEHRPLSVFRNREEFGAVNPLTRAPSLILEDGHFLSESTFILDYLDELAGQMRLVPKEGPARLTAHRRLALALVAAEKAVALVVETQLRPKDLYHAPMIERARNQVVTALALLEREHYSVLEGRPIDQVAITTAVIFRFIRHVDVLLAPEEKLPVLTSLSVHCEAMTAFKEVHFA
jgi:glutathione S-transferase